MYYFLPFGFTNVIIFVNNPCGSYSAFAGAEMSSNPFRQVTTGVADLS